MHADSQEQPTLRAAFRVHTAPCTQVRINTPKDPTDIFRYGMKRENFLSNLRVFHKEVNI